MTCKPPQLGQTIRAHLASFHYTSRHLPDNVTLSNWQGIGIDQIRTFRARRKAEAYLLSLSQAAMVARGIVLFRVE